MPLSKQELSKRYVQLANEIARLTYEASELEVGMSEGEFYPMTLNVYNNLVSAHAACRFALHTLSENT